MPEVPAVPDDGAGVRAANARLREQLAERDARIAEQDAVIAVLREHLAGVRSQVADLAARVASNSRTSSKPPSSDGLAKPAPKGAGMAPAEPAPSVFRSRRAAREAAVREFMRHHSRQIFMARPALRAMARPSSARTPIRAVPGTGSRYSNFDLNK